jgi:hypothetical protein
MQRSWQNRKAVNEMFVIKGHQRVRRSQFEELKARELPY